MYCFFKELSTQFLCCGKAQSLDHFVDLILSQSKAKERPSFRTCFSQKNEVHVSLTYLVSGIQVSKNSFEKCVIKTKRLSVQEICIAIPISATTQLYNFGQITYPDLQNVFYRAQRIPDTWDLPTGMEMVVLFWSPHNDLLMDVYLEFQVNLIQRISWLKLI